MIFNSFEFLIFFPIVIAVYFLVAHRWRWLLLLIASYYFYMCWKPQFALMLVFLTIVPYFAALGIANSTSPRAKKIYLATGIALDLGFLFVFKYFNFFNTNLHDLFGFLSVPYPVPLFDILLPLGISFHTFQTLSYMIDVYYGRIEPERHAGIFAVFVVFFPQLVAGPIERSGHFLPQFRREVNFDYDRIMDGTRLMLWGFFKKVVVADNAAVIVNQVYNAPAQYEGLQVGLATFFFAIQIYGDFSGYSDIALGAARILGFNLMQNFRTPYFSASISEFWQRWHISLSSWFRDYVYIPLGGNRVVKWRHYYNLFITFLVSGLWHGANWTFIAWGALHGFYLIFAVISKPYRDRINEMAGLTRFSRLFHGLQVATTFALVCFAWIFFRANSIADAFLLIKNFLHVGVWRYQVGWNIIPGILPDELFWNFVFIACMITVELMHGRFLTHHIFRRFPVVVRLSVYVAMIVIIFSFGRFDGQDFIYFQF